MSGARAAILVAIRAANAAAAPRERDPASAPSWDGAPPLGRAALVALLAERVADYRATVTRVATGRTPAGEVASILARHGAQRIATPAGLPVDWRPADVELVVDDPPLDHHTLGAMDAVLTGCTLAIAETGTLVLVAGAAQGRRALTLLPDLHVCVVRAEQVVADVPDAIAALAAIRQPITFVSGPSATSDIELERVDGVHGPRRLEVVVTG